MRLVCPECKNDVDLSSYPNLAKDQIVECNMCGMTLMVTNVGDGDIKTDIVDEGK